VTDRKAAKRSSPVNRRARVQLLASFVLLCVACAKAAPPAEHERVTIPIPVCAVNGVAPMSDDRHVAVNCGHPVNAIVVVDVQQQSIVTTLPTRASYTMQGGFSADADGSILWFGSLPAAPESFGLQRSRLSGDHLETVLIAAGFFSVGRETWVMPNFVAIAPRLGCAVWRAEINFAFDLRTRELTTSAYRERPSDLPLVESCARNESDELVPLVNIRGRAVNFDDSQLVDAYYFGEFDPAESPSAVRIARPGSLGWFSSISLSDHVFALFMNYERESPRSGDRGAGGVDFDARTCGLHAVIIVDAHTKQARCIATFHQSVYPIGFGPNLLFWADGAIYLIDARSLSPRREAWRIEHPPLGLLSPSGRLMAWVSQRGELHVIRN
jgi:hypothetical protein